MFSVRWLPLVLFIPLLLYKLVARLGQNALTLATHAGNAECVRMLLARWSYLDYTESALMPPLCVAAFRGHLELVKMFANLYPSPEHIKTVHGEFV